MNNYELMVIFTPILSEEESKLAQKNYQDFIKQNGGEIVHSNLMGLKSLAYSIQDKTTGIYWVIEYTAGSHFNDLLKIQILRDETIMRHIITKLDKNAIEYNHIKRNGGFPKHHKIKEEA